MYVFEVVGVGLLTVAVMFLAIIALVALGMNTLKRRSMRTVIPLAAGAYICGASSIYILYHQHVSLAMLLLAPLGLLGVIHIIYFAKEWGREGKARGVPK